MKPDKKRSDRGEPRRKHSALGWAQKVGRGFARSPYDGSIRVTQTHPVTEGGNPVPGKWVMVEVREV